MYNRFEMHHGQEQARLSRTMSIMTPMENETHWTKLVFATLTLGMAAQFNQRLDALFVDHVVYEREWQAFLSYCTTNWKYSALVSTMTIL